MPIDPVVDARELSSLSNLVLFDCRTGPSARNDYAQGHLPGAIFADLDTQLSHKSADAAQGGRHPLPSAAAFAEQLGRWGVTPASHVVAYDDQGGANAAARLWWMVRALGHECVQVLDGGVQAAAAAGVSVTDDMTQVHEAPPYPAQRYALPTADIDQVDRMRQRDDARVLDVRSAPRFRGEVEPIDPIAGHIPGAHNVPFSENLREGRFKTGDELRALYLPLLSGRAPSALAVHCGSGVTACHTLLSLERAGLSGAKLYVGSWSEWCRRPEHPREPAK